VLLSWKTKFLESNSKSMKKKTAVDLHTKTALAVFAVELLEF